MLFRSKSPRAGEALAAARERIAASGHLAVPGHLRAAAKTYQSPHAAGEPFDLEQRYLPAALEGAQFYHPSGSGAEAMLRDRIAVLRAARNRAATRSEKE